MSFILVTPSFLSFYFNDLCWKFKRQLGTCRSIDRASCVKIASVRDKRLEGFLEILSQEVMEDVEREFPSWSVWSHPQFGNPLTQKIICSGSCFVERSLPARGTQRDVTRAQIFVRWLTCSSYYAFFLSEIGVITIGLHQIIDRGIFSCWKKNLRMPFLVRKSHRSLKQTSWPSEEHNHVFF